MDKQQEKARERMNLNHAALVVLVERAGGEISFTEAEYRQVIDRLGGFARMNLRVEMVRQEGQLDTIRMRLEAKAARS